MLFLILLLFYSFLSRFNLLETVAHSSFSFQNSCSFYFTSRLIHGELASAFICGTPIRNPQAHEIFIQTGLIHLLVVSGSHLQMLSLFLSWLIPSNWKSSWLQATLTLLLLFYAFLTGFQPPVVRALLSRLLHGVSHFFRWGWDFGKITLASGLLILTLSPHWIFNFSFYLSWIASLGLTFAPLCFTQPWRSPTRSSSLLFKTGRFWFSCFCVQTLISAVLLQFSILGLLMNSLLAPLISGLLFPLSLSLFFIPSFHGGIDAAWLGLLQFLKFFAERTVPTDPLSFPQGNTWILLWIFLAAIHSFLEFLQRFRYRGSSV